MKVKDKIIIIIVALLFGGIGIYLIFISGNVSKFDSQARAYRIEVDEQYSDDSIVYYPIYYFNVGEKEYVCRSKSGSSFSPDESKNKVYYDSMNPEKCMTESDKGSSKFMGIICLVASVIIVVFFLRKPSTGAGASYQEKTLDIENQYLDNEKIEKVNEVVGKVQLIIKRFVLGIVIFVLLILTLFETLIIKQTIIARDYIETTAMYVEKKETEDNSIFDDCIYTFEDKKGIQQRIIVGVSKDKNPDDKIHIRYDENNPQNFYEDGQVFDTSGVIWYIVKVVAIVLLNILFFHKKLLSKTNITMSVGRN